MTSSGTVFDALGLAVGLVPDDVGAQIPFLPLQGERHQPWHADQVFRLQSLRRWRTGVHGAIWIFLSVARHVRPPEVYESPRFSQSVPSSRMTRRTAVNICTK